MHAFQETLCTVQWVLYTIRGTHKKPISFFFFFFKNPITKTHLNLNLPVNVPFAPFSRSDKLGRIADWTHTNFNNPNQNHSKNPSDSVFDFSNDDSFPSSGAADDDSSFRLVDNKPPPKPKFGPKWRFQQQRQVPQRRDEEVEAKKREAEKERARRDRHYNNNRSNANNMMRREPLKSSVDIQPEWNMLDQIPFSTFSKLSFSVPKPEDLLLCGALEFYDRSFDRITPKNERRPGRFTHGTLWSRGLGTSCSSISVMALSSTCFLSTRPLKEGCVEEGDRDLIASVL
ncbi:hypothetical protein SO802_008170 [Lithocarpus litseifolius]|uniref:Uncharacterized protein n=1 Tax=Lithocarpus litseifolius TaxID=425828 RepID=A0AAW2DAJ6_9ROSI